VSFGKVKCGTDAVRQEARTSIGTYQQRLHFRSQGLVAAAGLEKGLTFLGPALKRSRKQVLDLLPTLRGDGDVPCVVMNYTGWRVTPLAVAHRKVYKRKVNPVREGRRQRQADRLGMLGST